MATEGQEESANDTQPIGSHMGLHEAGGGGGAKAPELSHEVVGPPQCSADNPRTHRTDD